VPSRAYAEVVSKLPADGPVLSLMKGLDPATGGRPLDAPREPAGRCSLGPNFAEEIGSGLPAAAVIASEDEELAERLQQEINR
jgi:glycerol-3-phosphate dehydrogenase (NAD(P)+)